MPPSSAQVKFFQQLTEDREFPKSANLEALRSAFGGLSQDTASKWIEKALELPKADTGVGDNTPPPF